MKITITTEIPTESYAVFARLWMELLKQMPGAVPAYTISRKEEFKLKEPMSTAAFCVQEAEFLTEMGVTDATPMDRYIELVRNTHE